MLKLATIPGQRAKESEVPWAKRCRKVASRQRQSAEMTTLPRVREQMLRSAEKWEFLASSYDAELGLAG